MPTRCGWPVSATASSSPRCASTEGPRRAGSARGGHAGLARLPGNPAAHAAAPLGAEPHRRNGGVARSARSAAAPRPHVRARHSPRADAGKHSRRAVPSHQALHGRRPRPARPAMDASRVRAAGWQDAGHSRPRRHRPRGREKSRGARASGGQGPAGRRRRCPTSSASMVRTTRTRFSPRRTSSCSCFLQRPRRKGSWMPRGFAP